MAIKEYDVINDGETRCSLCGCCEDIVFDEDGEAICTECLFERETEEMFGG